MKNIKLLNKRLEREGLKWRARTSEFGKLSEAELQKRLGWSPASPSALTAYSSERAQALSLRSASWSPGDSADMEVDWRNRNSRNYVTPVKNQATCGSCNAFACVALIESMALIEQDVLLDLSEADLAFEGSHAANCTGWNQTAGLGDAKTRGVVLESVLPYALPPVRMGVPNHDAISVKITDQSNIENVQDRKSYLTHVGPMVAGIVMYDEFAVLGDGAVFQPSSAAKVIPGGHIVLVIGYSDVDNCWLIKNSWGNEWGDHGFARIAYGAMLIDAVDDKYKTYFTTCEGVKIPAAVRASTFPPSHGEASLANGLPSTCCDGFYSDDDDRRHAILADASGQITELFFHPKFGHGQASLLKRSAVVDVGAFYTSDDGYRHVAVATADGSIAEVFYSPKAGVSVVELGHVPNATRVSGFYTPDDGVRHVVVATSDGTIHETFFGKSGLGTAKIGQFQGIVDICAFYSPDDNYRHVIVGTTDGTITEIYFHPNHGISQVVLGKVERLVRLAGFTVSTDDFYSRRVLVLTNVGRDIGMAKLPTDTYPLIELRWSAAQALVKATVTTLHGVSDIGAFYSADDNTAHCVCALKTGEIREIFYRA